MADQIDLSGEIQAAIDGAILRGRPLVVAYVREDGSPAAAFRGSTYVYSPTELAIWVRKRDEGFAKAIEREPRVSLAFLEREGPGAAFLMIHGRARLAPELADEVYAAIPEPERNQDSERKGVPVVVDVDGVTGAGSAGFFQQSRS
jgi:pyridoxamine 5'-phosphate oxidase-like protein